ncbi:hypothetical protein ACJX0J_015522, partial [Zea mays]
NHNKQLDVWVLWSLILFSRIFNLLRIEDPSGMTNKHMLEENSPFSKLLGAGLEDVSTNVGEFFAAVSHWFFFLFMQKFLASRNNLDKLSTEALLRMRSPDY